MADIFYSNEPITDLFHMNNFNFVDYAKKMANHAKQQKKSILSIMPKNDNLIHINKIDLLVVGQ